jgi:hypothetical protein
MPDFLSRRALYARAAAAIYGERWRMPLAAAIGVNHRTVRGWFEEEPRSCPSAEMAGRLDTYLLTSLQVREAECKALIEAWGEPKGGAHG